ncbi:MAG TPA: cbb3-type cytochrome c oxidase subunit 3 [Spongiibacteraceae bacterium]|nr:cbb3-type cytochrome c oxidase subunit 3 [Spongiibacteraceae bacterium]
MTLEILRGLGTVLALCAFIGICRWAYSAKRKPDFDAAAQLPFADDQELPFADDEEQRS